MPESAVTSNIGLYRSGVTSPERLRRTTVAREHLLHNTVASLRESVRRKSKIRLNNLAALLPNTNRNEEDGPLLRRAFGIVDSFHSRTKYEHPTLELVTANYQALQRAKADEPDRDRLCRQRAPRLNGINIAISLATGAAVLRITWMLLP